MRTGNAGTFRSLIKGADIAIANFENPAPNAPKWHTKGTVFSADPRLIDGLARTGIDYVSLANNHIRDAGASGLLQTITNVKKRGIAVSGAGRNLAAARVPAVLTAAGTKVAILGYDAIAGGYHATATKVGSAPLSAPIVKQDVAAARKAGADVVIVFPHWGTEYDPTPFVNQTRLARMIIDSGADMVIGNHAHWAGAMELYKGKAIWYALGNFVFDQTWSEPTMEGITLELTFRGTELVQVRMRPHIILDKAQPNFLDPAGDGRVVMGQVFTASKGLLPW
jgi:poly-gamma-glutamate synthesis protein (capsule biosynthesis protein)